MRTRLCASSLALLLAHATLPTVGVAQTVPLPPAPSLEDELAPPAPPPAPPQQAAPAEPAPTVPVQPTPAPSVPSAPTAPEAPPASSEVVPAPPNLPATPAAPIEPAPAPAPPAPVAVPELRTRQSLEQELALVEMRFTELRRERGSYRLGLPIAMLSVGAFCGLAAVVSIVEQADAPEGVEPSAGPGVTVFGALCAAGLGVGGALLLRHRVRARRTYMPEIRELQQRRLELRQQLGVGLQVGSGFATASAQLRF